jgi:hypothetical protein
MVRFVRPRFAAVPLIAAAIIAVTTASGWAFTQQMLGTGENGNYNFNYTPPDHPATSGLSASPFDSNSSRFHFSIESGQTSPFSGFQSGNHSLGNSGNPTDPKYYIQPQGSGN